METGKWKTEEVPRQIPEVGYTPLNFLFWMIKYYLSRFAVFYLLDIKAVNHCKTVPDSPNLVLTTLSHNNCSFKIYIFC